MNGLPYYKAYPRDFIEGTIGMSFELKGAYRLVLDLIYMQGGNLPDDARYISGLLGCSIRKWTSLRDELVSLDKIQASGGFLTNYRAVSELETLSKLQDKQRENGTRPKKNKRLEKPPLNHTEPEPDTREANASLTRVPAKRDAGEFSEFWKACPRKIGKGAAQAAYAKALRKTDAATLFSAMTRYAQERDGKEVQYTVHPATWLNQERWTDEPPPDPGANFHDQISNMLRGTNGLPDTPQIDNRASQHVPAALPSPGTPRSGPEPGRTAEHGRGHQQPHLGIVQPRRFG